MSLTFGQAKEILAPYQGKGGKVPTNDQLNLFTYKVLQYMMLSGAHGSERKFSIIAVNGCFTAPYELDVPLKLQVNGAVGNVGSKWFEYHSGNDNFDKALSAESVLLEEPNYYCTVFDAPVGAQIGACARLDEDCDKVLIVSGSDPTGRDIFTNHKGAKVAGEALTLKKDTVTWTNVSFGSVTSIVKPPTNGYVTLYWKLGNKSGFLSDYSPTDESPSFRRFKLLIPKCPTPAKVSILARMRLKPNYADNEVIPFTNIYAIEVAGQQNQAQFNNQLEEARAKDNFMQTLINRESQYKHINNGNPVEVFHPLSGGTIRGIND